MHFFVEWWVWGWKEVWVWEIGWVEFSSIPKIEANNPTPPPFLPPSILQNNTFGGNNPDLWLFTQNSTYPRKLFERAREGIPPERAGGGQM